MAISADAKLEILARIRSANHGATFPDLPQLISHWDANSSRLQI